MHEEDVICFTHEEYVSKTQLVLCNQPKDINRGALSLFFSTRDYIHILIYLYDPQSSTYSEYTYIYKYISTCFSIDL